MATFKAANITNADTVPMVASDSSLNGGSVRAIVDTIALSSSIATNDIVVLARVPAKAKLLSVKIANDDLGTTCTADIGFYTATKVGGVAGTALDVDALKSAAAFGTATVMTDYRFATLDINTAQQPVWDLATLSAAPSYSHIDICATLTSVATPSAGDVSIIVEYTYEP